MLDAAILNTFLPPANEVWGKVIFSVACVKILSRWVCLSACWDTNLPPLQDQAPPWNRHPTPEQIPPPKAQAPPESRHPPGADTSPEQKPHWTRQAPTPWDQVHPLHSVFWEIWSTSGRYASY